MKYLILLLLLTSNCFANTKLIKKYCEKYKGHPHYTQREVTCTGKIKWVPSYLNSDWTQQCIKVYKDCVDDIGYKRCSVEKWKGWTIKNIIDDYIDWHYAPTEAKYKHNWQLSYFWRKK